MLKLILGAAIIGFLVALSLESVAWYVNSHGLPRTDPIATFQNIADWLWPTAIMLLPSENSWPLLGVVELVMSAIANAFVYAMVAFCVAFAWRKLFSACAPQSMSPQ